MTEDLNQLIERYHGALGEFMTGGQSRAFIPSSQNGKRCRHVTNSGVRDWFRA